MKIIKNMKGRMYMLNENFNVEKMFGLDAYEDKYGVTPQEQTDEILFQH